MRIDAPLITGSLNYNGTSLQDLSTYATTSSVNNLVQKTGSYALTGSNYFSGSQVVSGSITATGNITAQTLIVQTITSSVLFTTGSNKIGSSLSNVQELTGSVGITGSLAINGTTAVVGSGTANYVPKFTASSAIGNSLIFDNGTNLGLATSGATYASTTLLLRATSSTSTNYAFIIEDNATNEIFSIQNSGALLIKNAGTTRLAIASTGAATFSSSAGEPIVINSTNTTTLNTSYKYNNGTQLGYIGTGQGLITGGGSTIFAIRSENSMAFSTNGGDIRMTISSTGIVNLYSPTTNADALNLYNSSGKLNIKMGGGGGGANQSSLSMYNSANTLTIGLNGAGDTDPSFITGYLAIGTTTNSGYRLYVNGTSAGTSAFQNVSDRRLKKDITSIENGLDKIKQLNGVSFNWNKELRPDINLDDNNHLGLIAQDVEEVLPQVVTTGEDELQTKTIAYTDIVPVLIEAIKELSAKIDLQQEEIEILKNK